MSKKKVMIVDDEKDLLELTRLTLESTGKFEVLALSEANDIIQNLHNFKPDIVLLDVRMPGIGGLDACKMLNSDPLGKNIPIIIVSILESDKDKLDAYKVGVVDYAPKSIAKEDLVAKIEKALHYKSQK